MRLAVLSLLWLFVACFQEPPADRVWRCTVRQRWDSDARSGLRFRWNVGYVYAETMRGWLSAWHSGGVGLSGQVLADYNSSFLHMPKWLQAMF